MLSTEELLEKNANLLTPVVFIIKLFLFVIRVEVKVLLSRRNLITRQVNKTASSLKNTSNKGELYPKTNILCGMT